MKILTNKSFVQKIIIALVFVILFNFAVPIRSSAFSLGEIGLDLLKELVHLFAALGDVVMGALNKFMLGTTEIGRIGYVG